MIIFITILIVVWFIAVFLALLNKYKAVGSLYVVVVVLLGFVLTVYVPNHEGYAVQDKFIGKEQAIFLGASQNDEWIYLFVQFQKEDQPRLVKIPNTPSNQEQAKKLQEQNEGSGVAVLQFGENQKAEGGAGNSMMNAPGIRALDLPETELYGNKTR